MKNVLMVGAMVLLVIGIACLLVFGTVRSEQVKCHELVKQAEEMPSQLFYITAEEDAMCRSHGIIINAKVQTDDNTNEAAD